MIKYIINKMLNSFIPSAINKSIISKNARLGSNNNIIKSTIGDYTYTGKKCTIVHSNIGKFTSIADNCLIGQGSHPLNLVSTSPLFYQKSNPWKFQLGDLNYEPYKKTCIGNDVWIGEGVKVKSGVIISDGAVIGMGSIVTKDIGPYEVWAGNPAKFIKYRIDEHIVMDLLSTKWWNLDLIELRKLVNYMSQPAEFINRVKEVKKNE